MSRRDKPQPEPVRKQSYRDVSMQHLSRVLAPGFRMDDKTALGMATVYALYDVSDQLRMLRWEQAIRAGHPPPPDLLPPGSGPAGEPS